MPNKISGNPLLVTALLTLASVVVSLVVTKVVLAIAGLDVSPVAYLLAAALPAMIAPLTIYPFVRSNAHLMQLRTELERLAHTDVLTDLPNRRAFFETSHAMLQRPPLPPTTVAALMVDIDHFKAVNDTNGHDAGDIMLRAVATMIREAVATSGATDWTVARLGGEEFVALVEGLVPSAVARLADRICYGARRLEIDHRGGKLTTTLSIGVAFRTSKMSIDDLLKAADDAVYLAKRGGRDRWRFAHGDAEEAANDRNSVRGSVAKAP